MSYVKTYESFFGLIGFNKNKITRDVKDALEIYENELLNRNLNKIKFAEIQTMIKYLDKKLGKNLVKKLNIDTFLKGLYTLSGTYTGDDLKDKISNHFSKYTTTIRDRVNKVSENEIDEKDEEMDSEFRELKKLKKKVDVRVPIKKFEKKKTKLQIELLKLQEWYKENNEKVILIFEGRDAAGKGSCINTIIEF